MKTFHFLVLSVLIAAVSVYGAFAGAQAESPEAAKGPVTVSWFMRWDNSRVEAVAKPVMKAFEDANPNITLEFENIGKGSAYYTKLNTLAAAGEMPDVTYLAPHIVATLSAKNILVPIDDYMKKHKIDPNLYYQNVLNFYKYKGKTYGLPIDAAALVVFYNENMFKDVGVPFPQKGWTWEDVISQGKKFVKDADGDGITEQFAIHLRPDYWPVMIKAETDHTVFDDYFKPTKYLMTQNDSVDALQKFYDMWLVQGIAPNPEQVTQIKDYFMAGKAGMIMIGSWNMPKYIINIKDFKWNLAPLPIGKSGKEYNRGDGSSFCLSSHAKHKDEAFEFIKFLAGPGAQGVNILLDRQQMLPALKSMAESDRFLKPDSSLTGGLMLNKQAYFFGNKNQFSMYDPINLIYGKVNSVHKSEYQQAHSGVVSAKEAVERSAEQIAEILKEVK